MNMREPQVAVVPGDVPTSTEIAEIITAVTDLKQQALQIESKLVRLLERITTIHDVTDVSETKREPEDTAVNSTQINRLQTRVEKHSELLRKLIRQTMPYCDILQNECSIEQDSLAEI